MLVAYYFAYGLPISLFLITWVVFNESKKDNPQKVVAKDAILIYIFWPFCLTLWLVGRTYRGIEAFLERLQDYE